MIELFILLSILSHHLQGDDIETKGGDKQQQAQRKGRQGLGTVEFLIAHQERWTRGLPDWIAPTEENVLGGGYNAVFIPCGETRTLAQIPPLEALDRGYREPNFVALLQELGYA